MLFITFITCFIIVLIFSLLFHKEEQEELIEEPQEIEEEIIEEPQEISNLTFAKYIGQKKNIDYLTGHIRLAREKEEALPHIVLWGIGGLGKSTLIKTIASELNTKLIEIVPANLRNINDLFIILFRKQCISCGKEQPFNINKCLHCKADLKNYYKPILKLKEKDILFLEECHGLKIEIEEALYSLMQDKYIMLRYNEMDQRVYFPNITIAGATTKLGDLNQPFRDRFKLDIHLEPYTEKEINIIINMYAEKKGYEIIEEAIKMISKISFGIPRIGKKYIDDARTRGRIITEKEVREIFNLLNLDKNGLDNTHRKVLEYIHKRKQAGQSAIASAVGLNTKVYVEVYEPALLYKNLIFQGNRGRKLTEKAKEEYFNEL